MSKKLKVLIIVIAVIVSTAALFVGGYFLINNLSSTTVYNLQIVSADGSPIKNTSVYLTSEAQNNFKISVKISASNNSGYYFESSNTDVANVVKIDNDFYVKYYKPGEAIISVYSRVTRGVYDNFKVTVYNNIVGDIVIDGNKDNIITVYGDGNESIKNYIATGIMENLDCNNMQLRVVDDYNKNVFNSISIDAETQSLKINTKLVTYDSTESFCLQSYYIDENGNEHVEKNYQYTLNVIGYRIQDIQLLVSENYQFTGNSYLFLSYNETDTDKSKVFKLEGEEIIDHVYITKDVKTLFFKIRVVYSNSTYADISTADITSGSSRNYVEIVGGSSRNMDYWSVTAKDNIPLTNHAAYDYINFSYTDIVVNSFVQKEFEIIYLEASTDTESDYYRFINKELYERVADSNLPEGKDTLYYSYIYWDSRFKRTDAITNANGQIIDFTGENPDCNTKYIPSSRNF